ncbi:MAG: hypothetical protein AAFR61_31990 [Bacteroidota bacterium]
MKKILRYLAIGLGSLIALVLLIAAVIALKPLPNYQEVPIPDLQVDVSPERIQNGAEIFSVTCNLCHMAESGKLEGKLMDEGALGKIYSANLTQHPVYGIGQYTDGELYRLLRTGINREGRLTLPMMLRGANMSEEDLFSLIAFLRSDHPDVAPSAHLIPPYKPTFLAKMLYTIAFKPLVYADDILKTRPSIRDTLAYGRHLVNDVFQCYGCHSAAFETNNEQTPTESVGYLEGGMTYFEQGMKDSLLIPGLTMRASHAISKWSADEFIQTLKTGMRPNGKPIQYPMQPYAFLDSAEIQHIFSYLKSVPMSDPSPAYDE